MKVCRGCKEPKSETEFYNYARSEDGLHPECKGCCKVNRSLEAVRKRDRSSKVSLRQKIRAREAGVVADMDVNLPDLFKRAKGICALCKRWVQPKLASMDHIKPISKGGSHTWDNMQLVHLKCNLRKGATW